MELKRRYRQHNELRTQVLIRPIVELKHNRGAQERAERTCFNQTNRGIETSTLGGFSGEHQTVLIRPIVELKHQWRRY